jgi:hypothetical protein
MLEAKGCGTDRMKKRRRWEEITGALPTSPAVLLLIPHQEYSGTIT